jgi:hypothetical protein
MAATQNQSAKYQFKGDEALQRLIIGRKIT